MSTPDKDILPCLYPKTCSFPDCACHKQPPKEKEAKPAPAAGGTPEIDLCDRGTIERAIVGSLRSAIDAHGPITRDTAPSAAKRVIGAIKSYNRQARLAPSPVAATVSEDKLSYHDWVRLKDWFASNPRKHATLAFTAGAARDAATAFEAANYQPPYAPPPVAHAQLMTLERFTEIWSKHNFKFECSPHLQKALFAASDGDFSEFDRIEKELAAHERARKGKEGG